MRPELAALVVHDLKNALGALEAELDVLASRSETRAANEAPGRIDDDAIRARRSHHQCGELRQRFVQFLAIYAAGDHMQAHCSDESPRGMLKSLVESGSDGYPGQELVIVDEQSMPPFWYFDRRLVRMALDAAMHNARRFARQRILLSARADNGHLVFCIDDDGPGLSADDPSVDSTGLGTALCESVARAHSTTRRAGRVMLGNRPGGGARFELWLG